MADTGSSSGPPRKRRLRRALKWLGFTLAGVMALLLLAVSVGGLYLRTRLRASLPQESGETSVAGLTAPVEVERDSRGVPSIRGADRLDVARGTGFVHAQDRFFQMDLLRRRPAGELAELFGAPAVRSDLAVRVHRFRPLARRIADSLPAQEQSLLLAYAEGVNAGLGHLAGKPAEYLALGVEPEPWAPEDSVLVLLGMFRELQDEAGRYEATLATMHDTLPPELFRFLAPVGSPWEAPLVGELHAAPLPGPEVVDLRSAQAARRRAAQAVLPPVTGVAGSNGFALAGSRTAHGGAMLANDVHLSLTVPNLWYRVALSWPHREGDGGHRLIGVTLPGAPPVVIGSNGHVAWGLVNSRSDASDLVIVEEVPEREGFYVTPDGPQAFERHTETIQVRGGADQSLEVLWTIWGPVVGRDPGGRLRALRWVAHDPEAVSFGIVRLEEVRSIEEALALSPGVGVPAQSLLLADSQGRIAWTVLGRLPRRKGLDGRLPYTWSDGERGWEGWEEPDLYPVLDNPPAGCLWAANNRLIASPAGAILGDGNYALGSRAAQIRDRACALEGAGEEDLLAIQLDDRAPLLEDWRRVVLDALTPEGLAEDPRRRELHRFVTEWSGRASADSVGYRLLRTFRLVLAKELFDALTAPCRELDPDFDYFAVRQFEAPLWALVTERPAHLLPPGSASWETQILAAIDATLDAATREGEPPLAEQTWGQLNISAIRHPFSRAAPFLAGFLDMPAEPMSGDGDLPRVQLPNFGASFRMVVSPGREEEGLFHMPAGQSGHPLSPHYRDGHGAWSRGEATPLLPGPAVRRLTLRPAAAPPRP